MWSRFSWEDIYVTLSRERHLGEAIEIHKSDLTLQPEAAGAAREVGRPDRLQMPVSDGSVLLIQEHGEILRVRLRVAPLPSVGWAPQLPHTGWIALPACLMLLGVLGIIA